MVLKLNDNTEITELEIIEALNQNGVRPTKRIVLQVAMMINKDLSYHMENYETSMKLRVPKNHWLELAVDYCLSKLLEKKIL